MEVKLSDQTLVHLNYHSVPRSIYAELKPHIEVLFNKGWIVHSTSSYSSPVVSVWKKDGSLWLCCNYHKLYSKNLPNLHPLPNIQTSLQKTRRHSISQHLRSRKSLSLTSPQSTKLISYKLNLTIGFLWVVTYPLWPHECSCRIPTLYGTSLPGPQRSVYRTIQKQSLGVSNANKKYHMNNQDQNNQGTPSHSEHPS